MAQSPNKTRYKSLSIITFLLVLFSFAYYYFIYVSAKKEAFNEKAFRIVENVGDNIEDKYKNFTKIIQIAHTDLLKNLIVLDEGSVKEIKSPGELRKEFDFKRVPDLFTVDSVQINAESANKDTEFEIESSTKLEKNLVVIESKKTPESDASLEIYSKVSYKFDSLFNRVLPREFFKKYIIFSKTRVYYSDIAYDKNSEIDLDTLFINENNKSIDNIFHSSDIAEIEFNDETQLLYITPINVSDSTAIFIAGIVEKSYYHRQAFQLEANTLAALMIFLVLLVLSIPFIKLLMMSGLERMHSSDAVLSFLAIILGSSFIILGLVTYFTHNGPTSLESDKYLQSYAETIEQNFGNELKSILKEINKLDVEMEEKGNLNSPFPYDQAQINNRDVDYIIYPYLVSLNWTNSNGDQVAKWSTGSITPRVNLKFRPYFSIPNNPDNILWNYDVKGEFGDFYLQSIFSVTTGKTNAAISKRSKANNLEYWKQSNWEKQMPKLKLDKKPTVVTLITNLKSLENLPIPSNITYIVIDENGQVLFHKNKAKILQENVIEEMNNDFSLTNAIYGRDKVIFNANYDESAYRVLVKPIGEMPVYLVVLLDKSALAVNDAQILSLAALFNIIMFIIFAFQITYFTIVDKDYNSKTKVKRQLFRTIWPNKTKTSRYFFLIVYITSALLIYVFGNMYDNVILTYSFFSLLITVNLLVLRRFHSIQSILKSWKYAIYFAVVLFIAFSLAFASQIHTIGQAVLYILFVILSAAAIYFSFKIKRSKNPRHFKVIFNTWMFLFVVGLSVGPAFSFFSRAYNYEKLLYVQDIQYDLADNIVKNGFISNDVKYQDFKTLNKYHIIDTIDIAERPSKKSAFSQNEEDLIEKIRFRIKSNSNKLSVYQINKKEKGSIIWDNDEDFSKTTLYYRYKKAAKSSDKNKVAYLSIKSDICGNAEDLSKITLYYLYKKEEKSYCKSNVGYLRIKSDQIHLDPKEIIAIQKDSFEGKIYVVIIGSLLFAIALFYLITYYSKTIFLLGMIPNSKNMVSQMAKAARHLYIISPPYVGITHFLKDELGENNCQFIDMRFSEVDFKDDNKHILDVDVDELKKYIVIFDNGKKEPDELRKKFLLVSQIKKMSFQKDSGIAKIIFVSQVTPQQIISYYKDEFNSLEDKAIVANFFDVLGDFVTAYFPMKEYVGSNQDINEGPEDKKAEVLTIGNSSYWMQLSEGNSDKEDRLLNMQNKDQLYFYALWTGLEKREKFLLYDLAQDGLVNYRNLDVIYNLLNREYIHYRGGRLQVFSNEFANFMLTIIDEDEALELEKELQKSGRWASLRLPLFTIIGGILVFIFLTQQEVLNQLIGWITAALALLPLLSRLMAGLPFLNKAKGKIEG